MVGAWFDSADNPGPGCCNLSFERLAFALSTLAQLFQNLALRPV